MALATPATRNPSTYKGVAVANLDQYVNDRLATDLIFREAAFLHILDKVRKVEKPLGRNHVLRYMDSKAGGFQAFDGFDTLTPQANLGPHGALLRPVNYAMPLMKSLTQELEEGTEAIFDRMEFDLDQIALTFRDEIDLDLHRGNVLDTKRVTGLEQWLYAVDHSGAVPGSAYALISDVWKARQADNTIAGVTRDNWDASVPTNAVSHLENIAINIGASGTSGQTIGYSSSAPTGGMKALMQCHSFPKIGVSGPNVCLMSRGKYEELVLAGMEKQFLQRDAVKISGVDVGIANVSFNGCAIILDERAATQVAAGGASAGTERYYFLNTSTWKWLVDPRMNMKLLKPRPSRDSLSAVRWVVLRCLPVCENPRMNSTGFAD